jgi:hypothetical protein
MTSPPFLGKSFSNFLTKEEVDVLLNHCVTCDDYLALPNDSFWNNRILYFNSFPPHIKKLVIDIINRMQKVLRTEYNLLCPIYPDEMQLTRMFDGMENSPHCDDMSYSETEKHLYSHRQFGCVIYLNDDFQGGKLYYTNFDVVVTPEIGKLAVHPANYLHKHGVTKLCGKTRYSLASFWTFEKTKALQYMGI